MTVHLVYIHSLKDKSTILWEVYSTEKVAREAATHLMALNNDRDKVFTIESRFVRDEF